MYKLLEFSTDPEHTISTNKSTMAGHYLHKSLRAMNGIVGLSIMVEYVMFILRRRSREEIFVRKDDEKRGRKWKERKRKVDA